MGKLFSLIGILLIIAITSCAKLPVTGSVAIQADPATGQVVAGGTLEATTPGGP